MSLHSPKNTYRCEIHYERPVEGVGSVQSFTHDSIEGCRIIVSKVVTAKVPAQVIIYKNMKVYPHFDWKMIDFYFLDKDGKKDWRLTIGAKIAAKRIERGMSQKDLADSIGMHQPNIARIEHGRYSTTVDILCKIAEALGTRLDFIE